MKTKGSRAERWNSAVKKAGRTLEEFGTALEELKEIQEEYDQWYEALPENLASSLTGVLLEAITSCDLDGGFGALQEMICEELPAIDPPRGPFFD